MAVFSDNIISGSTMHRLMRIVLPIAMVFFSEAVYAQAKLNYFSASVPVKSQSASERASAARKALSQVLVRMSGSEKVLGNSLIKQKTKSALNLVEQFQYRALDSELLKEDGYKEMLSLTFASSLVEKMLNQAQQPFWSVNRPTTLIWLAEDTLDGGRQILNQHSDSLIIQSLSDEAERRGLPVIYPLLDLDDQLALSAEDVWSVDEQVIARASERYDVDVILVGRYSQTSRGEVWSIWQFFHAGSSQSYDSRFVLDEKNTQLSIGASALDPLANFLAQRYAISPQLEASGRLVMQVAGVNSFGKYRRSLDYLEGLAAVSEVQLAAVRQDTMLVYLESEASIEKLLGALALDGKMQPVSTGLHAAPLWQQVPRGTMENPLRFEWSI